MELNSSDQAFNASGLSNPEEQGFDSTAPIVSVQIVDYDGDLPPDANVVDITHLMQVLYSRVTMKTALNLVRTFVIATPNNRLFPFPFAILRLGFL